MSSIILNSNQRELVKFDREYLLDLQRHRKQRKPSALLNPSNFNGSSRDSDTSSVAEKENKIEFSPSNNNIDSKLYDKIVNKDTLENWKQIAQARHSH